jgi:galactose mutarotase-like enzyme
MSEVGAPATVELADPVSPLRATFVPGANMLCSSLHLGGEELLAQNDGVAAYVERGATMGIPLLYPWANRLAAFDYTIAGRAVELPHDPGRIAVDANGLPIHGIVGGRIHWSVTSAPSSGQSTLVALLSWNASAQEDFALFPFAHEAEYRADLADGALAIEVTLRAGDEAVPVAFGFHPYLSLPRVAREEWVIELPAMRHLELDDRQLPTHPGARLETRRFGLDEEEFDDGFDAVSDPARFAAQAGGQGIGLELIEGYRCAQVYSPRAAPFICFEPMTAPTNALRSGEGLELLAPGEQRSHRFQIDVRGLGV